MSGTKKSNFGKNGIVPPGKRYGDLKKCFNILKTFRGIYKQSSIL